MGIVCVFVIFFYFGVYSVELYFCYVLDDVFWFVKKNNGIVMVMFVNCFLNMKNLDQVMIYDVVDYIIYIVEMIGWEYVGIGSDFFGMLYVFIGFEDVFKFFDLIELLMKWGVIDDQICFLVGDNILCVWLDVEQRVKEI